MYGNTETDVHHQAADQVAVVDRCVGTRCRCLGMPIGVHKVIRIMQISTQTPPRRLCVVMRWLRFNCGKISWSQALLSGRAMYVGDFLMQFAYVAIIGGW